MWFHSSVKGVFKLFGGERDATKLSSFCFLFSLPQTFPTGEGVPQQPHRDIGVQAAAASGASHHVPTFITQRSPLAAWRPPYRQALPRWATPPAEEGVRPDPCGDSPPCPPTVQQSGLKWVQRASFGGVRWRGWGVVAWMGTNYTK